MEAKNILKRQHVRAVEDAIMDLSKEPAGLKTFDNLPSLAAHITRKLGFKVTPTNVRSACRTLNVEYNRGSTSPVASLHNKMTGLQLAVDVLTKRVQNMEEVLTRPSSAPRAVPLNR